MQLPHPVLLVGLGGTGQWIACHVLKELMDLYGLNDPNEVLTSPQIGGRVRILAIDTDQGNPAKVGRGRRQFGMGVGEVRLPDQMRLSVGAQIMGYAQQIASGQHPQIGSWFDATWFLNQMTAVALLNLTTGAQQFRPLGRVAVPYNLTQFGGGIRTALTSAIQGIANAAPGHNLLVCIVGSLCGGTGAGMVADIAHLVQRVAEGRVPAVSTRAYLVLPNAFEGTVQAGGSAGFSQRTFAAMRELRRFAREVRYEIGYPMHYAGPEREGDEVLRGRAQQALFELMYYFDAGLVKVDGLPAKVEEGMALLIAEAILPWVDGETRGTFLSHAANLTAQKAIRIAGGALHPQAAVAGGIGLYSLQLPIQEIIEEWTYGLAREALRMFLGVRQEDATTKTVTHLWDNRVGGVEGISGRDAARAEWETGQIGGQTVSEFIKEVLRAGRAGREGPERKAGYQRELMERTVADWQRIEAPPSDPSDEDKALMAEFLYPTKRVLEKDILQRPTKVLRGQVQSTEDLSGDARRNERRSSASGAERVHRDAELYLDKHLGPITWATGTRGGDDRDPSGLYPRMLRRWCCQGTGCREGGHVADYRTLLQKWVALSLNGTPEPERTTSETPDRAVQNRSGRLGYTLALLDEIEAILSEAAGLYGIEENRCLGLVSEARAPLSGLGDRMNKDVKNQEKYLEWQQQVLERERTYACVRAMSWSAEQMLKCTQEARDGLKKWRDAMCKDRGLYQAVWQAQEQAATNLAELKKYSAVREVVDAPEMKAQRYQHYAQGARNALGETLNALRWQVAVEDVYDKGLGRMVPSVVIGFELGDGKDESVNEIDSRLTPESHHSVRQALIGTCRQFFDNAREHETVLGWLQRYYDGSSNKRQLSGLAARMSTTQSVTLRTQPAANPHVVAYVRSHWSNVGEQTWVNALLSLIRQNLGADQKDSQAVDSTDPYRLTLITFQELIDVEKLTTYDQGKTAYLQLNAKSDGVGLARQVLHVFAAERNAAVYEQRLGRLLPDRIVALLEEPDSFRQFVRAWALGSLGSTGGRETLIHEHRLEDGRWVYRLTTGPFEGEIDPGTLLPKQAEHRWLCEPVAQGQLSLFASAETFCLRGADKWQMQGEAWEINKKRVEDEIEKQRLALANQTDVGQRLSENLSYLVSIMNKLGDTSQRQRAQVQLAELEHLQEVSKKIQEALYAATKKRDNFQQLAGQPGAQAAAPQDGQQDVAARAEEARQAIEREQLRTSFQLDPDLYRLMSFIIADEMAGLVQSIKGFHSA